MVPGGFWWFLVVFDGSLWFFGVFVVLGGSWWILVVCGGSLWFLMVLGGS